MDPIIIKETMEALDRIIIKFDENESKLVIKTINKLIATTDNNYLCDHALPTIRNFLRKYPG